MKFSQRYQFSQFSALHAIRGNRRQRSQKGNGLQQHHKLSEPFWSSWQKVMEHRM